MTCTFKASLFIYPNRTWRRVWNTKNTQFTVIWLQSEAIFILWGS